MFKWLTFYKLHLIQIKLYRPAELIQMLILIPSGPKMIILVKLLAKYVIIINLCIRLAIWKVRGLNQSCFKASSKLKFLVRLHRKNG